MHKINRVSLYIWIGIVVVALAIAVSKFLSDGFEASKQYFFIAAIAAAYTAFKFIVFKRISRRQE